MARLTTEGRLRRILAMVPWVVSRYGPTVEEVCERFSCTPTELASDISLLYLCGLHPYTPDVLIDAEISDGRVWISYAEYFRRPLRLTPAEGLALIAAASTLLSVPGTDPEGPLARGLAKLAAALGGNAEAVEVELGPVSPATLKALRQAADDARQVEIDYYNFGKDERAWRTIEPAGVFAAAGHWYVSAFCTTAADARVFRVDRIITLNPTERPRVGPPSDPSPGLFARRPTGGIVVLDLAPAGAWVIDQYPVDEVTPLPGGHHRVRLAVSQWAWLDRLLLRLGEAATVLQPPIGWPGLGPAAQRVAARYAGGDSGP